MSYVMIVRARVQATVPTQAYGNVQFELEETITLQPNENATEAEAHALAKLRRQIVGEIEWMEGTGAASWLQAVDPTASQEVNHAENPF